MIIIEIWQLKRYYNVQRRTYSMSKITIENSFSHLSLIGSIVLVSTLRNKMNQFALSFFFYCFMELHSMWCLILPAMVTRMTCQYNITNEISFNLSIKIPEKVNILFILILVKKGNFQWYLYIQCRILKDYSISSKFKIQFHQTHLHKIVTQLPVPFNIFIHVLLQMVYQTYFIFRCFFIQLKPIFKNLVHTCSNVVLVMSFSL